MDTITFEVWDTLDPEIEKAGYLVCQDGEKKAVILHCFYPSISWDITYGYITDSKKLYHFYSMEDAKANIGKYL